jgi:hypothetical protein
MTRCANRLELAEKDDAASVNERTEVNARRCNMGDLQKAKPNICQNRYRYHHPPGSKFSCCIENF